MAPPRIARNEPKQSSTTLRQQGPAPIEVRGASPKKLKSLAENLAAQVRNPQIKDGFKDQLRAQLRDVRREQFRQAIDDKPKAELKDLLQDARARRADAKEGSTSAKYLDDQINLLRTAIDRAGSDRPAAGSNGGRDEFVGGSSGGS